jgi:hypothetical protein
MVKTAYSDLLNAYLGILYTDSQKNLYRIKEINTRPIPDAKARLECERLDSNGKVSKITFPLSKLHKLQRVEKSELENKIQKKERIGHDIGGPYKY